MEAIKISAVHLGHLIAGDRRDGDGRKGPQRVMPDNRFVCKDDRGDGCVERGGNGAGHATAEKGDGIHPAQVECLRKSGAERGTQVYRRSIAPHRGAQPD